MKNWKKGTIKDLAIFQRGHDLPDSERKEGIIPVVGSAGINGYHNKAKAKAPGVTLGRSGASIGKAFYINTDYWPHNAALYVTDFKGNDPKFVYYFLKLTDFSFLNSGSAQPSLNRNILHAIKIAIPPLETQKKIAAILSAYDDLIETNKQRIALLEKMAEEIYREWFVRFRFPGWQNTEFEKGIPKDWKIKRIDSLGKVITGKTPPTTNEKFYNGEIHFIKTPDMHDSLFILDTQEKLSIDGLNSQPSQIIPENSICVSCIGTAGVVSITTQKCSTNQQINSIVLRDLFKLEFAFYTLKSLKETINLFGSTGATMTNLSKGKLAGINFIAPDDFLIQSFHNNIAHMFKQVQKLSQINRNLEKTKSDLLPRLISGKLSVENLDIALPPSLQ